MNIGFCSVKGYTGYEVTKKMLENKKWSFEEIKKENAKIMNEIEKVLDNKGIVLALAKKKVVKAIYIFKLEVKEKEKILIFDKKLVLEEVNECVEEFENDIQVILGEAMADSEHFSKVIFGDKEIEPIHIKIGKFEIPLSIIWILVGIIFWILFDDFLWFLIYSCIGASSGYAVKINEKKRKVAKGKKKQVSKKEK